MIEKNSSLSQEYFHTMVDRIYKILPLYEEENEGLFKYIQSLIYELDGLLYVVDNCVDYNYIILISTLESLSDDALLMDKTYHNKSVIRREVFKCINTVKKIEEKATSESGDY